MKDLNPIFLTIIFLLVKNGCGRYLLSVLKEPVLR